MVDDLATAGSDGMDRFLRILERQVGGEKEFPVEEEKGLETAIEIGAEQTWTEMLEPTITDDGASVPEETEYPSRAIVVTVYITVPAGGEDATAPAKGEKTLATTTGEGVMASEMATSTIEGCVTGQELKRYG
jgi:hypothetical protein